MGELVPESNTQSTADAKTSRPGELDYTSTAKTPRLVWTPGKERPREMPSEERAGTQRPTRMEDTTAERTEPEQNAKRRRSS